MNKKIVIINGSGGVGKDTFIDFCRLFEDVINISSVDKIKEAAKILGWDGGKNEADRKFLSDLKLLSIDYNNLPYDYIKECISEFNKEYKYDNTGDKKIMFIHVREPEEIEKIKNDFGCITLLIKNINKEIIVSNMADANVCNYKYDYVICNNYDLGALKDEALKFLKHVL